MTSPDIVLIAHFSGRTENSNSRFRELADILARRGADVELVTSSFLHEAKAQRDPLGNTRRPYAITHIREPGYRSNVSVRRLLSHRTMAKNLRRYLDDRAVPDLIYCAMPSNAVAAAAAAYARSRGVRLVLDVQDLWPEAYEMVIKPRALSRRLFTPLRWAANRTFRAADHVVTVSDTYSQRVLQARRDGVSTTFLGTNLTAFDRQAARDWSEDGSAGGEGAVQLAYIGTLGHSYTLPLVFDALRLLRDRGVGIVLHVMGSGPLEQEWRDSVGDLAGRVIFHGRLAYPEMVARLRGSDIAINPIRSGSAGSIINKVCDYAAAGLPVVNTQESPEYQAMLERYHAGITTPSDPTAVADALERLAGDPQLRATMGAGSRRLGEECFDRAVTYERLADLVLERVDTDTDPAGGASD